jgi:hypothetical protein
MILLISSARISILRPWDWGGWWEVPPENL